MVEKDEYGVITADKRYWWLDGSTQPFEERTHNASGTLVTIRRFFKRGEIEYNASGVMVNKFYYTKDHTGSPRDLVDSSGNVQAMYDYDPYGRRTRTAVSNSTADTVVSYTGHHWHEKSGLYLTMTRQYDPELGRWLSRDPIEEEDNVNLYGYVSNNPIVLFDPLGLAAKNGDRVVAQMRVTIDVARVLDLTRILPPRVPLMMNAILLHGAYSPLDFKVTDSGAEWNVGGQIMKSDEFGNYLAGYHAGYAGGLGFPLAIPLPGGLDIPGGATDMYMGMRTAGLYYAALGYYATDGNSEHWSDRDSVPKINEGFEAGKQFRLEQQRKLTEKFLNKNDE